MYKSFEITIRLPERHGRREPRRAREKVLPFSLKFSNRLSTYLVSIYPVKFYDDLFKSFTPNSKKFPNDLTTGNVPSKLRACARARLFDQRAQSLPNWPMLSIGHECYCTRGTPMRAQRNKIRGNIDYRSSQAPCHKTGPQGSVPPRGANHFLK